MGMLSGELLNGHLFDSNGLIQKVVDLGPISELQKMRDKHLYNVTPWRDKRGLRLFFSDEEGDSDDDSRLAVTTAWGIRLGRRGSMGMSTIVSSTSTSNSNVSSGSSRPMPTQPAPQPPAPPSSDSSKDRIALDISLLKKQYDKLRERQRQAHIILTTTARQTVDNTSNASSLQVNQYLMGRNAIVSQKGRRIGPPPGAIPPVRKVANLKATKNSPKSQKRGVSGGNGETLLWKDIDSSQTSIASGVPIGKRTKDNISGFNRTEVASSTEPQARPNEDRNYNITKSPSVTSSTSSTSDMSTRSRKKSESSSYSDESDGGGNSSTSTSLCDDDNLEFSVSSIEVSPLRLKQAVVVADLPSASAVTKNEIDEVVVNQTQYNDCIETLNKINSLAEEKIETVQTDGTSLNVLVNSTKTDKKELFLSDSVVGSEASENFNIKEAMMWNASDHAVGNDDVDDDQIINSFENILTDDFVEPTTDSIPEEGGIVTNDMTDDYLKTYIRKNDNSVPENIILEVQDYIIDQKPSNNDFINKVKITKEAENTADAEKEKESSTSPTDDYRKYKEIDDYLQIISIDSSSSAGSIINKQMLLYDIEKPLLVNDENIGNILDMIIPDQNLTAKMEMNSPITLEEIAKKLKESEEDFPPLDHNLRFDSLTSTTENDKENVLTEKLDRINCSLEELIARTGFRKETTTNHQMSQESEFLKIATSSSTSIPEIMSNIENDESLIECDSVSEQDSSADISISKYIFVKDYPESIDSNSVTSANPLIDYCVESTVESTDSRVDAGNYRYSKSPAISLSPIDDADVNDFNDFNDNQRLAATAAAVNPNVSVAPTTIKDTLSPIVITSTSQLSPIADISKYLSGSSISPLKTPSSFLEYSATKLQTESPLTQSTTSIVTSPLDKIVTNTNTIDFKVNYEGVTNEYFERITAPERPSRLDLRTSITDSISSSIMSSKYFYGSVDKYAPTDSDNTVSKPNETLRSVASPSKRETTTANQQADKMQTNRTHSLANSTFMKEKSLSLDESTTLKKNEFRPTSCPETVTEGSSVDGQQNKSADRVLKIIEENSMILHRILKKTMCNDEMGTFVEEESEPQSQLSLLTDEFAGNIGIEQNLTNIVDPEPETQLENFSAAKIELTPSVPIMETNKTITVVQPDEDVADISVTLTSIQNTIKSVQSLCQYDENKTAELLAACERLAESEAKYTKTHETVRSPIIIEPTSSTNVSFSVESQDIDESAPVQPDESDENATEKCSLNLSRYSRDSRRELSPRRKGRDDDREEYESRVRRDVSSCSAMSRSDVQPRVFDIAESDSAGRSLSRAKKAVSGDYSSTFYDCQYKRSYENIEKSPKIQANSVLHKSYESNLNSSELGGPTFVKAGENHFKSCYGDGKLEIRHSTVTSTFYDRFLSQKKERKLRLDKSPSSPIITKTYLDSLRLPTITVPSSAERSSKSAENSPSRPTKTSTSKMAAASATSATTFTPSTVRTIAAKPQHASNLLK